MTDDELRDELAEAWCADPAHDPVAVHGAEVDVLLPVVRRFADAQVAAERERLAATLDEDAKDANSVDNLPRRNALRWAARVVRGER